MRVAYVCADPGVPVFGRKGCSVHVQEVCRALLERHCDVTVFASRRGGDVPARLAALRTVDLPCPGAADPGARELALVASNEQIGRTLEELGPFDLIYERASLWTVAPMVYARRTGAAGVLELNAPLVDEQARYRTLVHGDVASWMLASSLRTASVVAAVSTEVAAWAARAAGPGVRVHVVPNGVDIVRFPERAAREPANGRFVVGFVGTLKPWHGLDVLVDAFASLAARLPAARLLVIGDGPERTSLVDALAARGLSDKATLTGSVRPDEVPAWLAAMDVATAPYPALPGFYFSPLKVTEYMAAGLPVVASAIGQVSSLVRESGAGVLVPPGDASALADALFDLAVDAARRSALGRAGRAHVAASCTWRSIVGRVLALAAASEHGRGSTGEGCSIRAGAPLVSGATGEAH